MQRTDAQLPVVGVALQVNLFLFNQPRPAVSGTMSTMQGDASDQTDAVLLAAARTSIPTASFSATYDVVMGPPSKLPASAPLGGPGGLAWNRLSAMPKPSSSAQASDQGRVIIMWPATGLSAATPTSWLCCAQRAEPMAHRIYWSNVWAVSKSQTLGRRGWTEHTVDDVATGTFFVLMHALCLLAPWSLSWHNLTLLAVTMFMTSCFGISMSFHRQVLLLRCTPQRHLLTCDAAY